MTIIINVDKVLKHPFINRRKGVSILGLDFDVFSHGQVLVKARRGAVDRSGG
jgi:hypothetical protein